MLKTNKQGERIEALFHRSHLRTKYVVVLGRYVHILTFKRYAPRIKELMAQAGFNLGFEDYGETINGDHGLKLVFDLPQSWTPPATTELKITGASHDKTFRHCAPQR